MSRECDFTKLIIQKLKDRASSMCSNPECRKFTTAANTTNAESVTSIGIAAHITAASPGGSRYTPEMSKRERKSIHNGIWLCSSCATKIDRDVEKYSVELLHKWKKTAEQESMEQLGKKALSDKDVVDTMATAFTGYPKHYLANAISNTHMATSKSLEALDPRFNISTKFDGERATFSISAKEPVALLLNIPASSAPEFSEKFQKMIDHGQDLKMLIPEIAIEGSELFDEIFQADNIHITPSNKVTAIQKIWLSSPSSHDVEFFGDICGNVTFGTKSFTFKGDACEGLFELSYITPLDANGKLKQNIDMKVALSKWDGLELSKLDYFDKLFSLFTKMSEGWLVHTSLEINGKRIFSNKGENISGWNYIDSITALLWYTQRCMALSQALGIVLIFQSDVTFTKAEHQYLIDTIDILGGTYVFDKDDLHKNPITELVVESTAHFTEQIINSQTPALLEFVQNADEEIMLFGETVSLPRKKLFSFENVLPKVKTNVKSVTKGQKICVEWVPQEGFKGKVTYILE